MNVVSTINKVSAEIVKHGPTIMTGLGVGSMAAGTIEAVKATPAAYREYETIKEQNGEVRIADYIELLVKHYWKTGLYSMGGAFAISKAHKTTLDKLAVVTAALKTAEEADGDYKKAVEKVVGKKKSEEIRDRYCADKVEKLKNTDLSGANIIRTGNGEQLCYDIPSDTLFYSSYGALVAAKQEVIDIMQSKGGYASVDDFHEALNIGPIKLAEGKGWLRRPGESVNDTLDITIDAIKHEVNGVMQAIFAIDYDARSYTDVPESDRY